MARQHKQNANMEKSMSEAENYAAVNNKEWYKMIKSYDGKYADSPAKIP